MGEKHAMTSAKFPNVTWEDEDTDFDAETRQIEKTESEEFEVLLGKKENVPERPSLRVGQKVRGVVSRVNQLNGDIMVDLGGKDSGIIEHRDLVDDSGATKTFKVGDTVEVFIVSRRGGDILLSQKMSTALRSIEDLEAAQSKKIPVRGRVSAVVKGGVEVSVLGKTAFCPISQLDTRFLENAAEFIGQDLEFLIERVEGRGRNIVLTRAPLLRQRAETRAKEIRESLELNQVFDGTVTEIRDFGAFVDIGGVEGLVHISELAYGRVAKAGDVVEKGAKVRVKVLKVENDAQGRPKISLSMKQASQDPWDSIYNHVASGESYTGRVVNLMPFGAFVEVKPGIEGLLHISELSWVKRVHHPSEILKVGDTVTVKIKDIDTVQKRLSLSMKSAEDDPWLKAKAQFPVGQVASGVVERLKPFGALVTLVEGVTGLVPLSTLKKAFGEAYRTACSPGKTLEVKALSVNDEDRKILLSLKDVEEEEDDHKHYLAYLKSEEEQAAKAKEAAQSAAADAKARPGTLGALLSAKLQNKKS
jgi:small subunit ribosomal protein S1